MNKQLIRIALLGMVLVGFACKSAPRQSQAPVQPSPQALAAPATQTPPPSPETIGPAPAAFKKTFVGTIGDNLAVQMDIERAGAKISGSYFYDKPGAWNLAHKLLDLNGAVDKDGNVTIRETNSDPETGAEKRTGVFTGKLDAATTAGQPTLRLTGVWTGVKDKKSLAVSLRELTFDLGGLQLSEKRAADGGRNAKLRIESRAPQLTGADAAKAEKFNQTVANFVANRTVEFKKVAAELMQADAQPAAGPAPPAYEMDVNYTVTAATPEFISILFYFYQYTGGAHPNTKTASFNYNLKRGEALQLADLFTPQSNYLQTISAYSIRELKKLKTVDSADEGASPKLENFQSWNLTPAGLRLTFDRYSVAAYAAGDHEVVIPYAVLKPILKPDGLLGSYWGGL
jgi:Deacetylase PdaC/Protein of unknown function (DUF3298)